MPKTEFETAQQAAARLGITVRAVQKQAAAGKPPGAERYGRSWMIPADYTPGATQGQSAAENDGAGGCQPDYFRFAMPLLNSTYPVGRAKEYINAMPDPDVRNIALAEYCLFTGKVEEAARIAEPYIVSHDAGMQFSANLICAFANLGLGHGHLGKFTMKKLSDQVEAVLNTDAPPQLRALAVFAATMVSVDFLLSQADALQMEDHLSCLPGGFRQYACCVLAHKAYLAKDYGKCLTIAELSLALSPELHPIAAVYTHVAAAMALINMKHIDESHAHMDKAWKIAEPDGLLQPFVEHHGLLQGMVEVYFSKAAPDVLSRIMELTEKYSAGWWMVHRYETKRDVADNLTTTEFTIAMLYNRGWKIQEIADHLEISVRTVNRHIATIYEKLGIHDRGMLDRFMLQ